MDFSYTEEQTLLRNSVQRFVQDKYSFEARKAILASKAGWSRDNWKAFAELGLLAAPFAEETLLRAARMFEKETNWHKRRPSFADRLPNGFPPTN